MPNVDADQVAGIIAEALRLVMVQRLLSSAEFKMDPLVSVYYYAPACALVNGVVTLFVEAPRMTMDDFYSLGVFTLIANALVAFLLNVSVVLLVCLPVFPFRDIPLPRSPASRSVKLPLSF